MSEQLPRFWVTERTPQDGPLFKAASAWSNFSHSLENDKREILRIIHAVTGEDIEKRFFKKDQLQGWDMQLEMEERLSQDYPHFIAATNGLRRAFDRLNGEHIAWNNWQRGEVIGYEQTGVTDELVIMKTRRAPATYPEYDAYVIGNRIGPDPVLLGFGAWIELGDTPVAEVGIHNSLYEMHAIRLASDQLLA